MSKLDGSVRSRCKATSEELSPKRIRTVHPHFKRPSRCSKPRVHAILVLPNTENADFVQGIALSAPDAEQDEEGYAARLAECVDVANEVKTWLPAPTVTQDDY